MIVDEKQIKEIIRESYFKGFSRGRWFGFTLGIAFGSILMILLYKVI